MWKNNFLNSNTKYLHKKEPKSNQTIVNYFKENKKLLFSISYFSYIFIFILLDYLTFIYSFNFSSANFLEIYLYSIDILSAQFFFIVTLIPFFILLVAFFISLIGSAPILLLYKFDISNNKIKDSIEIVIMSTFLLTIFSLLYSKIIYEFIKYIDINNYYLFAFFLAIQIGLTFITIGYILSEAYKKNFDYISDFEFSLFLILFLFFFPLVSIFIGNVYHDFALYLLVSLFFTFGSLIIVNIFFNKKNQVKKIKYNNYFLSIGMFIIANLFIFIFHNSNVESWRNLKNSQLTWNLFINKFYKSNNNSIIDINTTTYTANNITQHCVNEETNTTHISLNAEYLPISKEMKLYFKEKADDNITCIYAINKKFYKNKYNYILEDIGYINTSTKKKDN